MKDNAYEQITVFHGTREQIIDVAKGIARVTGEKEEFWLSSIEPGIDNLFKIKIDCSGNQELIEWLTSDSGLLSVYFDLEIVFPQGNLWWETHQSWLQTTFGKGIDGFSRVKNNFFKRMQER